MRAIPLRTSTDSRSKGPSVNELKGSVLPRGRLTLICGGGFVMTTTTGVPPVLLTRLRAETRAEHDAIDATLDLTGDGMTRDGYRHILERFYGFYAPLEPRLQAVGGWADRGLDLDARQKAPLLDADLRSLGVDVPTALPRCDELPLLVTPADCFGCLYVMEGSTLGGQLISRHVRQAIGVTPETGGRFFNGYGERTGQMWQQFRAAVTGFVVSLADQDAAVAAAKSTFQKLQRWTAARGDSP